MKIKISVTNIVTPSKTAPALFTPFPTFPQGRRSRQLHAWPFPLGDPDSYQE